MDHSLRRLQHIAVTIFLTTLYCIISHLVSLKLTMPAKSIEDASIKEDVAWGRSVLNKVLTVHSQHFVRELICIRSRAQPAPTAVLDDGARAIADDGVAASLQRQQERGFPCAGAACDDYSRHTEVPFRCSRCLTPGMSVRWNHLLGVHVA
jgi:hypothetical protein